MLLDAYLCCTCLAALGPPGAIPQTTGPRDAPASVGSNAGEAVGREPGLRLVAEFPKPEKELSAVAISPDGAMVAGGNYWGELWVWDAVDGRLIRELVRKPGGSVDQVEDEEIPAAAPVIDKNLPIDAVGFDTEVTIEAVEFSPDGRRLAVGSTGTVLVPITDGPIGNELTGGEVRVWDVASGRLEMRLGGFEDEVLTLAFSRDGTRLAALSAGYEFILRDARSGEVLFELEPEIPAREVGGEDPSGTDFSADGRRVVSVLVDDQVPGDREPWDFFTIKTWDAVADRFDVWRCLDIFGKIHARAVAVRPDGQRFLIGCGDDVIRELDSATGRVLRAMPVPDGGWAHFLRFDPGGGRFVSAGGILAVWDYGRGEPLMSVPLTRYALDAVFLPDRLRLVTWGVEEFDEKTNKSTPRGLEVWDVDLPTAAERDEPRE